MTVSEHGKLSFGLLPALYATIGLMTIALFFTPEKIDVIIYFGVVLIIAITSRKWIGLIVKKFFF